MPACWACGRVGRARAFSHLVAGRSCPTLRFGDLRLLLGLFLLRLAGWPHRLLRQLHWCCRRCRFQLAWLIAHRRNRRHHFGRREFLLYRQTVYRCWKETSVGPLRLPSYGPSGFMLLESCSFAFSLDSGLPDSPSFPLLPAPELVLSPIPLSPERSESCEGFISLSS